jgi:hypothetical protein
MAMLERCVKKIDLDHPEIDYDIFINVLRAIKAACNGDRVFFTSVVWPWTCTQKEARGAGPRTEERGIEWLEDRWNSFRDSIIGADYVFTWAGVSGGYIDGEAVEVQAGQSSAKAQELFSDGNTDVSGPT